MKIDRRAVLGSASLAGLLFADQKAAARPMVQSVPPPQSAVPPGARDTYAAHMNQRSNGPVLLDYEREGLAGRDTRQLFADMGFAIRARAETGEDLHLWVIYYQQRGDEVILDGDLVQTTIVCGKFSPREKQTLNDTPFLNKGQNIEDYLPPGSMSVVDAPDSVTWSLGGRVTRCAPPHYTIEGSHGGVKCQLSLIDKGPALFQGGRFETLKEQGLAGFEQHGEVQGTIEVAGRTLKISGYYIHERWIMAGQFPARIRFMADTGLNWMSGWNDQFSYYVKGGRVGGQATGFVNVGDTQHVLSGPQALTISETSSVIDPKSRLVVPHRFHIRGQFEGGTLEATLNAYGRAYYYWIRRGGVIVVYQQLCDSDAVFTMDDGRVLTSTGMMAFNEYMRTMYDQDDQNATFSL